MTKKTRDAIVTRIDQNNTYPNAYILAVDCPYCPGTHTHGLGKDEGDDPGHRIPHCPTPYAEQRNPAYRLVIPQELFHEYF